MSKLLIMIDMQKGFDGPEARSIIELFNKYNSYFDHICFPMFKNKKKSLFETHLKWSAFQSDQDRELIDTIEIPKQVHYITHHNYTVYNDELKELIKKLKPEEIYLSGLFSDVCILKTSMDMFDDGIVPYIIKDLSASLHGKAANDVAFATMEEAMGEDRIILAKQIN